MIYKITRYNKRVKMHPLSVTKLVLTLGICYLVWKFVSLRSCHRFHDNDDDDNTYDDLYRRLTNRTTMASPLCLPPIMDPFSPPMMKSFHPVGRRDCGAEPDWMFVRTGRLYFRSDLNATHPGFSCDVTPVERVSEFEVALGTPTRVGANGTEVPSASFVVNCVDASGNKFKSLFASVKRDESKVASWRQTWSKNLALPRKNSRTRPPDVIMLGLDSLSHNAWRRQLPKTYAYFTRELGGIPLAGYNIVGDGTPQALLPILTGMTEWELPEARRSYHGAKPIDDHPWLWKNYSDRGYATAFIEDQPGLGAFTYRMLGFSKSPTDEYGRPHFMMEAKMASHWTRKNTHCLGERHRYKAGMLSFVKEHLRVLPDVPKLMVLFSAEHTHDNNNLGSTLDDDLVETLGEMSESGHLDNAVIIAFSDHGARFADDRKSEEGKIEERTPLFAFRFPDWFATRHRRSFLNFAHNADNALVTPFDVHATLEHFLWLGNERRDGGKARSPPDPYNRAISLFTRIPSGRTCRDAGVESHWCACLKRKPIHATDPIAVNVASAIVDHVNNLTSTHRGVCASLTLKRIVSVSVFETSKEMRKFKNSADRDGRIPDLSDSTEKSVLKVQVTLETSPGNALFEVTATSIGGVIRVGDNEISRINKYGDQPKCVATQFPHLRQFCYCV